MTRVIKLLICFLAISTAVQAQRKEKPESLPFKEKLWYGFGGGLGYNVFNGQSVFTIGLSPMVGYKFNSYISAGPRVSLFYSSFKVVGYPAIGLFEYETGLFLRGKIFRGFYVQGEISNEWAQFPDEFLPNGKISKGVESRFNQLLGAGYNWGNGGWGTEMGVYYNFALANDLETSQLPFEYRFAFTYKF